MALRLQKCAGYIKRMEIKEIYMRLLNMNVTRNSCGYRFKNLCRRPCKNLYEKHLRYRERDKLKNFYGAQPKCLQRKRSGKSRDANRDHPCSDPQQCLYSPQHSDSLHPLPPP